MTGIILLIFIVVRFFISAMCLSISGYLCFTGKAGAGWFLLVGVLFGSFGYKSSV